MRLLRGRDRTSTGAACAVVVIALCASCASNAARGATAHTTVDETTPGAELAGLRLGTSIDAFPGLVATGRNNGVSQYHYRVQFADARREAHLDFGGGELSRITLYDESSDCEAYRAELQRQFGSPTEVRELIHWVTWDFPASRLEFSLQSPCKVSLELKTPKQDPLAPGIDRQPELAGARLGSPRPDPRVAQEEREVEIDGIPLKLSLHFSTLGLESVIFYRAKPNCEELASVFAERFGKPSVVVLTREGAVHEWVGKEAVLQLRVGVPCVGSLRFSPTVTKARRKAALRAAKRR